MLRAKAWSSVVSTSRCERDAQISASSESGSVSPWADGRGRLVAVLCALLVLASTFHSTGLQGSTFASPHPSVVGYSSGELSADDPAQLAAILAWRQVAGVEATRIAPDGPPPQPATLRPSFPPDPAFAGRGAPPWPVLTAHTRLLPSNRTPTGPPIT